MSGRERRPPRFAEVRPPAPESLLLAAFDRRIGTLRERGWPVNKQTYLLVLIEGRSLAEEWDGIWEYEEQVPRWVPGEFPETLQELIRTRDELDPLALSPEMRPPVPESLQRLAERDDLVGLLVRRGYPLTKRAYVLHVFEKEPGGESVWPIPPEFLQEVPDALEGELPETREDLRDAIPRVLRRDVAHNADGTRGDARHVPRAPTARRSDDHTRSSRGARQWRRRR